jgi:hypothetical protein
VDVPLGRGQVRVNEFASVCFCSRAGVEFMDSTPKALKAALEAIRDIVLNALDQKASRRRHVRCDGNAKNAGT